MLGVLCNFSHRIFEATNEEGYCVGDFVIFKNQEGQDEMGQITYMNDGGQINDELAEGPAILIRKATANDKQKVIDNQIRAKEALKAARDKAAIFLPEMNIFRSSYSFDSKSINFIFTADGRVDFRDLVKELGKTLRKSIHLQQIGPRDKARIIQGFGRCGRPLCCATHLKKMESVTMETARLQGMMHKDSSKLLGLCGKLMCCLRYEVDLYDQLAKGFPEYESIVEFTSRKEKFNGMVIGLDILNQKVKIRYEKEGGMFTEIVPLADIKKIVKKPPVREERKEDKDKDIEDIEDVKESTVKQ